MTWHYSSSANYSTLLSEVCLHLTTKTGDWNVNGHPLQIVTPTDLIVYHLYKFSHYCFVPLLLGCTHTYTPVSHLLIVISHVIHRSSSHYLTNSITRLHHIGLTLCMQHQAIGLYTLSHLPTTVTFFWLKTQLRFQTKWKWKSIKHWFFCSHKCVG